MRAPIGIADQLAAQGAGDFAGGAGPARRHFAELSQPDRAQQARRRRRAAASGSPSSSTIDIGELTRRGRAPADRRTRGGVRRPGAAGADVPRRRARELVAAAPGRGARHRAAAPRLSRRARPTPTTMPTGCAPTRCSASCCTRSSRASPPCAPAPKSSRTCPISTTPSGSASSAPIARETRGPDRRGAQPDRPVRTSSAERAARSRRCANSTT